MHAECADGVLMTVQTTTVISEITVQAAENVSWIWKKTTTVPNAESAENVMTNRHIVSSAANAVQMFAIAEYAPNVLNTAVRFVPNVTSA